MDIPISTIKKEIHKIQGNEDVEVRLTNWIKAAIDLMKPQNLYLIGGRGVAKTTDIMASRTRDIFDEMPHSSIVLTSDTYVNLMANVIPNLILGWSQRFQFHEGSHFVVDKEPPKHFERPHYSHTQTYKHTISTVQGVKVFLTSLDRPSANAGISVVHNLGDESKYLKKEKLNKLFPTLRGDPTKFGNSPYYLGKTFCTDMPDSQRSDEDDWITGMIKNMDRDRAKLALQTGITVNRIAFELYKAEREGKLHKLSLIKNNFERWVERHRKVRFGLTFFYNVTSFANADILRLEYFNNLLEVLEKHEFETSVLGMKRKLMAGEKFYFNLAEKHFYGDGYNYDYYDKYGLLDNISQTSAGLRYMNHNQPLEAGLDVGKMLSMVIGQPGGNVYRILKNIYTIPDAWVDELCKKFREFFGPHKNKILKLYIDRSANQYKSVGQDIATKVKNSIEKYTDSEGNTKPTGWKVVIMTIGQGNIGHEQEYDLAGTIMGETNRDLPRLLIDKHECKELKSSLESTPLGTDSKGRIKKDKSSEQLPNHRLPMESTNLSDAFKYLICRKEWLHISKHLKKPAMAGHDYEPRVY